MKNKQKFIHHLGNTFIILSLVGFFYVFSPILLAYLVPPVVKEITAKTGTFITIPKIHAQAPVIEHVDPWSETTYQAALKKGVAHAKGTSLPGEKGTIFVFAHSTGLPWELTHFNTIFLRLGELEIGDTIEIIKNGKVYYYKVSDKKEVEPSEVNYLLQTKKNQLILQTCTPIGTSLKRLLIFAVSY